MNFPYKKGDGARFSGKGLMEKIKISGSVPHFAPLRMPSCFEEVHGKGTNYSNAILCDRKFEVKIKILY
jgi:hypothetical protein